jgi:hypothetical protein
MERLVMDGYDYHVLEDVDDDVLLLEWDIAIGEHELVRFAERARQAPDQVLVAPYPLYRSTISLAELGRSVYPFRLYNEGNYSMRWCTPADETCHMFGFGVVYLPRLLIKGYLADDYPGLFNDVAFSGWHYRNAEHREVPIAWDCPAVHLNYTIPEL